MPDWTRSFPDGDHRWTMGLRPEVEAAAFFSRRDATQKMLAERAHWLEDDAEKYAALLPEATAALNETRELLASWKVAEFTGQAQTQIDSPWEKLLALGRAVEPDMVWMHPDEAGTHRFIGGVVCFPSSWELREKLGRTMAEVHTPVPALNEEMGAQIGRFLQRLAPGVTWRREGWGLSRDDVLNHHPSHHRARLDDTITLDEVWLRLERQLLMRLPVSGSILFGIRVEVVALRDVMREDPVAAARLARLIETMSEDAAVYKGVAVARGALVGMLRGAR